MKNFKSINATNAKQQIAAVSVRAKSGERNAYPAFVCCVLDVTKRLLRWTYRVCGCDKDKIESAPNQR